MTRTIDESMAVGLHCYSLLLLVASTVSKKVSPEYKEFSDRPVTGHSVR